MALTMFNRARWTGKPREAEVFRTWLVDTLEEVDLTPPEPREERRGVRKG
jgi:hypothetical protein